MARKGSPKNYTTGEMKQSILEHICSSEQKLKNLIKVLTVLKMAIKISVEGDPRVVNVKG